MTSQRIKLGCEVMLESPPSWLRSMRLGLLCNQASVTGSFDPLGPLIKGAGGRLECLFSPQHGFCAEKQANMIESSDGWNESLSLKVFSLYGAQRQPTPEMLEGIDAILIDLQDVGTRVYTYGTTMGLCIEAAARAGIKVVVLDRPNPVNGLDLEGNVLDECYGSFVGRYPIPMRHGLTMGELARFIVSALGIECDLEVIPMAGWRRGAFFADTGLPWIFPSPNMPSWQTALLYPGMVLLEGTNISEGRGTTLPFQLFGAPFFDQKEIVRRLRRQGVLDGLVLRPVCYEPTFDKWRGQTCAGFQIHITEPARLRSYRFTLALLQVLLQVHGDQFRWLPPPYEYEYVKLPIDILFGDGTTREALEAGRDIGEIEESWKPGLSAYREKMASCLLYVDA